MRHVSIARIGLLAPLALVCVDPLPVSALAGAGAPAGDVAELLSQLEARRGQEVSATGGAHFASTHDGWLETGVAVSVGQWVTVLEVPDAAVPDVPPGANAPPAAAAGGALWVRIGDGDAFHLGGEAYTFRANHGGRLEVAVRPGGLRWADCRGSFPPELAKIERSTLDLGVAAIAWQLEPEAAMAPLAGLPAVARALAAYRDAPVLPRGFQPLCHLRNAPVFSAWQEGARKGVRGHARGSAGIIKHALDLPLDDASEITFDWRYDTLPAQGPETDPRHHDYSSIAIELDNGQDITWMWGTHVEAGTSFRCPLTWWDQRETHLVLQSGREGLGEWFTHTRRIADDYDRAVGGERPRRIVGLWFISVGAFGGELADATFANVTVRSGGRTVSVFD